VPPPTITTKPSLDLLKIFELDAKAHLLAIQPSLPLDLL
jgi:hypothetical protein